MQAINVSNSVTVMAYACWWEEFERQDKDRTAKPYVGYSQPTGPQEKAKPVT